MLRGLALLLTLLLSARSVAAESRVLRGPTMGTTYVITLPQRHGAQGSASLKHTIDALLEAIEQCMSTYRPDSELSRLSANPGTAWLPLSDQLFRVLAAAAQVSRDTAGAFDITVGPVVNVWGFGPEQRPPVPPTAAALAQARLRVGYRMLELAADPPRARKARADLVLDLSAIAKGYAVDRLAELLDAEGYTDYLITIAGEVRARGRNADNQPWQIGVAWPEVTSDAVARVLQLTTGGLSTSGDYRQYFEYAGVRYSHEIDPATAAPVRHALASVTVLHASNTFADAYATALLVLGPERGPELATRLGLTALFLRREATGFSASVVGTLALAPCATPDVPAASVATAVPAATMAAISHCSGQ